MNNEMQLAKLIFSSETTILPVCVPNKTFGLGEGQITIKISGELHPPDWGGTDSWGQGHSFAGSELAGGRGRG